MNYFLIKDNNRSRAFTLVEMIISLAVFSLVAVVALGAFMRIVFLNQKAQTLKSALNNVNFVMEMMSREIRAGTNHICLSYGLRPTSYNPSNSSHVSNFQKFYNTIDPYDIDEEDICDNASGLDYVYEPKGRVLLFMSNEIANPSDPNTMCNRWIAYGLTDNAIWRAIQLPNATRSAVDNGCAGSLYKATPLDTSTTLTQFQGSENVFTVLTAPAVNLYYNDAVTTKNAPHTSFQVLRTSIDDRGPAIDRIMINVYGAISNYVLTDLTYSFTYQTTIVPRDQ